MQHDRWQSGRNSGRLLGSNATDRTSSSHIEGLKAWLLDGCLSERASAQIRCQVFQFVAGGRQLVVSMINHILLSFNLLIYSLLQQTES